MKKLVLASVAFLLGIQSISAQGWIGNSSNNSLYPVNTSLGLTPLSIGIGTNAPSAQLHTTGSVRFGGLLGNNLLNRVLVSDDNGNLSFRDASTLPATGNFWGLTGNAITTGQFLGTTNDQLLDIRTNNVRRITVLGATPTATSGFVGLTVNDPVERLDVNGNIALRGEHIRRLGGNLTITAAAFNSNLALRWGGSDGVVSLQAMDNPAWGRGELNVVGNGVIPALKIGYNRDGSGPLENLMTMEENLTRFSDPVEFTSNKILGKNNSSLNISASDGSGQAGVILNSTNSSILVTDNWNGNVAPNDGRVYGNMSVINGTFSLSALSSTSTTDINVHHLRIARSGDVEVGTKLIIGNYADYKISMWREIGGASKVYFPSLPTATGSKKVLVWDETTGQVLVAPTAVASIAAPDESDNTLQKKIDEQNSRIAKLENALMNLQQKLSTLDNANKIGNTDKKEAKLYQNIPNPSSQNTVINFSVPKDAKSAKLIVYNLQGEQLKNYSLNKRGDDKIEIVSGELKTGMYIYTLIVDDEVIDSKKMVLTN